jgi:V8-like Glu-specific endopeptidase
MEKEIQRATCRVDSNNRQIGSAFWVTNDHLLTAAHVVANESEQDLTVYTHTGEVREVQIIHSDINTEDDPGSDVAVLSAQNKPTNSETLSLSTEVPKIGEEVIWSGYALLFGEDDPVDRQRFGWGHVASEGYTQENGLFFEVDGNFNPNHSGGPVINKQSGEVVGIVSESAGDFSKVFQRVQNRIEPMTRIRDFLKNRQDISGTIRQGFTYEDPLQAIQDKKALEELGFEIDSRVDKKGRSVNYLEQQDVSLRVSRLQADLSEILFKSVHGTVQMGVGIATGGSELKAHIPTETDT